MDSPFSRNARDSPFLRSQEAKNGQSSSFSLGPAMHETGGFDTSSSADATQGTADLTAFVQNLLQQMQSRFQSMSDAILVRIDEMASRIEELERAVDDVLREVTSYDDQASLPSPSSSPIRRAVKAPPSPDVRKFSLGSQGSFHPVSPVMGRYPSSGSLAPPAALSLNSSDHRRQSGSLNVPSSPDFRRQSGSGVFSPGSPDLRRHSLPSSFGSNSPARKSMPSSLSNVPNSPDTRRRAETHLR